MKFILEKIVKIVIKMRRSTKFINNIIRTPVNSSFRFHPMGYKFQSRPVSALYITGDKAKETCATLLPFMDFKSTFEQGHELERSIRHRHMKSNLNKIMKMYTSYKDFNSKITQLEEERDAIAKELRQLNKEGSTDEIMINTLKEKGKSLRNDLKRLKEHFYPVEDEFIHMFLDLPNQLHSYCPLGEHERLLYQYKEPLTNGKCHLTQTNFVEFIDNTRYYLSDEAAEFDIYCTQAFTQYVLQKGHFTQTANPDFVRCVLLEANATPVHYYHKVMEEHLHDQLNTAFLTGGASFESFLGAVTKLCVYPSLLPLKWVCCGRLYEKALSMAKDGTQNLFTATQSNAVQTFVATSTAREAEEQMDSILNLCVDFYRNFNIHFRVVYVPAFQLTPSESLRAEIEIYSPHQKRYICVGRVIGGPILYTTRLTAALLEHEQPFLDQSHLFEMISTDSSTDIGEKKQKKKKRSVTYFPLRVGKPEIITIKSFLRFKQNLISNAFVVNCILIDRDRFRMQQPSLRTLTVCYYSHVIQRFYPPVDIAKPQTCVALTSGRRDGATRHGRNMLNLFVTN
uniref:Serine-tRNA synthetase type1 N-terminal domain-containing protein n=1 Tax=Glossina austeni TaxID=7395 RepID=A0A1A9VQZ5_GLOAU